ncbi:MAG: TonB family protein [Treponema sp.]|jgi:protein TonB|nr:TonB family protein [Treponema sp.]
METAVNPPEPPAQVMKLVDIREDIPPPPPPPPQPKPVEPQQNVVEAIAETMIETDEVPDDQVVVESLPVQNVPSPVQVQPQQTDYLPQNKVSKIPSFSDQDLRKITSYLRDQYPPIALRSGLEGLVILELFIDSRGVIRQINILRENPEGRGFGDVAVQAFREIRALPAEANGVPVAVRFRYPIRFTVK